MTLKTTLMAATSAVALGVAALPALMVGAQTATAQTAADAYSATQLDAFVAAIGAVDGMDVELYSAILEQAAADPSLNERLTRRLQDAAEG